MPSVPFRLQASSRASCSSGLLVQLIAFSPRPEGCARQRLTFSSAERRGTRFSAGKCGRPRQWRARVLVGRRARELGDLRVCRSFGFLCNIVFPICCPVGSVAFGFFGEVFEEFREWEFQTRTTASTRRSVSVVRFPSCFGLISARYVRAPFPFLFVAQA